MTKSKKIWLGILTFLPVIFIGIFLFLFITLFLSKIYNYENNPGAQQVHFYKSMIISFVFIVLAVLIKLGLLIYYIIHVSDNKNNDNTKKLMWILILVFVGTIGSVIYYFLEIYPLKTIQEISTENE